MCKDSQLTSHSFSPYPISGFSFCFGRSYFCGSFCLPLPKFTVPSQDRSKINGNFLWRNSPLVTWHWEDNWGVRGRREARVRDTQENLHATQEDIYWSSSAAAANSQEALSLCHLLRETLIIVKPHVSLSPAWVFSTWHLPLKVFCLCRCLLTISLSRMQAAGTQEECWSCNTLSPGDWSVAGTQ